MDLDDLFKAINNVLPNPLSLATLSVIILYFGVFFFKGYNTHYDAIRDKLFLSICVFAYAIALLYMIHYERAYSAAGAPTVVIAKFSNDNRDSIQKAIAVQLEKAMFDAGNSGGKTMLINERVDNEDIAGKMAFKYKADAIVYAGQIMEQGEEWMCAFRVYISRSRSSIPCTEWRMGVDDRTLDEIIMKLTVAENSKEFMAIKDMRSELTQVKAMLKKAENGREVPKYSHKRAFIVGINNYPFMPVKYAVSDALLLGELLKSRYGFEIYKCLDENAQRHEIVGRIEELASETKNNDILLIYLSGHGTWKQEADTYYASESGRVPYFVPWIDKKHWGIHANEEMGDVLIAIPEIVEIACKHDANAVVVIVEAGMGAYGVDYRAVIKGVADKRVVVIQADLSMDNEDIKGGVMTYGLRNGAK